MPQPAMPRVRSSRSSNGRIGAGAACCQITPRRHGTKPPIGGARQHDPNRDRQRDQQVERDIRHHTDTRNEDDHLKEAADDQA